MAKPPNRLNPYPTQRQEQAMRDVLEHPDESLADRGARLRASRSGVLQILYSVESKGLAVCSGRGRWELTLKGRNWLRPNARSYAR